MPMAESWLPDLLIPNSIVTDFLAWQCSYYHLAGESEKSGCANCKSNWKMSEKKDINDTTVKLYIGGIDPDWSSDKIKEILAKHGDVIRVDVVKNFAFAVSSRYLSL